MSRALWQHAHNQPERAAIIDAQHQRTTYAELEALVARYAGALQAVGLQPKQRVAVFVRPGRELVALMFALLRLGSVPVLIDPGMGIGKAMQALALAQPQALIGVPAAVLASHAWRRTLSCLRMRLVVGHLPFHRSLTRLARAATPLPPGEGHAQDEEAAVLYTSGSTGPAKGVSYTHGNFAAQVEALRLMYGFAPGDIDLACFPLFALFDAALGTTTVFPRIDPSHPGRCRPEWIVQAAVQHQATYAFGSPAVWARVAPWLVARKATLPHLRNILVAGAPIEPELIAQMQRVAPEAEIHTPYGATEALPVATITGAAIQALRAQAHSGAGVCVGTVAPGIELVIARRSVEPLHSEADLQLLPAGTVGEVLVRGPQVTRHYTGLPTATARAKVAGANGTWHRMGDLGWIDEQQRLWFVGRSAHALETSMGVIPNVPMQLCAQQHPAVRRAAYVGVGPVGAEVPVLVLQPSDHCTDARHSGLEVLELVKQSGQAARSPWVVPQQVLWKSTFPLDVRHNAKIRNEDLKEWAIRRVSPTKPEGTAPCAT